MGDPREVTHRTGFQSATKPSLLSSAACAHAWRHMAKRCCGLGSVSAKTAALYSSSAATATGDIAIAARRVETPREPGSGVAPISVIRKASKEGWITGIGSSGAGSAPNKPA